jgi:vitamin B12 transporter
VKLRIIVVSLLALSLWGTWPLRAGAQPTALAMSQNAPGPQQGAAAGQETSVAEQEQLRHEEKVVVTADRVEESVENVGSAVSVITSEEIDESGALWLIEVLERSPGLSVARSGGPGAAATVFLRGTNSNHTLFMVDGVKLNSPTTGSYDFSHLQLAADQIERIEIVRGPQSPLYGSEAMGGVINVITKRGAGSATWGIEAEGGSYRSGRMHTWVNGQASAVRYTGSVSYLDSGGFSAATESRGNPEADDLRNASYNGRLDYSSTTGFSLDGFVRGFDSDLGFDDYVYGIGPADNVNNRQTNQEIYAGVGLGYESEVWTTRLAFSDSEADLRTDTPDGFYTAFALDAAVRELDWQNEVVLTGSQTLIGGFEYRREQAEVLSTSSFDESGFNEKVDVVGLYLHDRIDVADVAAFTLGGRYEDHSRFGGHWTFRATGTGRLAPNLRLHGSVGSAFRSPALNDLYFPIYGNPDLQPEESVGVDIGVETILRQARARLDVTFFRNDISELIDFTLVGFQNLGAALTQGLEVGGDWSPNTLVALAGSYTFMDATEKDGGEQLARRPRHQGAVQVTFYPTEGLHVFTELVAKGVRNDVGPSGPVALDAYALLNLAAGYQVSRSLILKGRIDNLLDTEYEEVYGFGTAGLSGYLGLQVKLGGR